MADIQAVAADAGSSAKGPDPQHHDSSTPQTATKSSVKALILGLLIALVMVSIMATTYVTADHAVVAHNLPWGQVGSSP